MPLQPPSEASGTIAARIATAERAKETLLTLVQVLDAAELHLAAIHVNAAVEQICSDLEQLKSRNV